MQIHIVRIKTKGNWTTHSTAFQDWNAALGVARDAIKAGADQARTYVAHIHEGNPAQVLRSGQPLPAAPAKKGK